MRGDDVQGGTLAADLMLRKGRRRLGVIAGPSNLSTMIERQSAILARLGDASRDSRVPVEDGGLTYQGGYGAALRLTQGGDAPDGLVCLTDIMAVGAMDALRQVRGLRVPEYVAVLGFDDIPEASHASYDLTTVRTPVFEMVDHVMRLISGPERPGPISIAIQAEIIERTSTGLDA